MYIAAGGLGKKQFGLAELVRSRLGSAVSRVLICLGPVARWSGDT